MTEITTQTISTSSKFDTYMKNVYIGGTTLIVLGATFMVYRYVKK